MLRAQRRIDLILGCGARTQDFFSMREGDLRDVLGRIPAADAIENELTEAWSGFVDKVDELEKQCSEYRDKKSKLTSRMDHVKSSQSAAQAELERLELETNDLR
jgi:chromosome segregation ATPase